jgi:hypothetical protein
VKIHVDIRPERDDTWVGLFTDAEGTRVPGGEGERVAGLMRAMALVLEPRWDSGGEV